MPGRPLRCWSCAACPKERIELLTACDELVAGGRYVLLWFQQDVRSDCNHSVEVAISLANFLAVPLVAAYGLFEGYPGASERCFAFLLDGLCELQQNLASRGVPLLVGRDQPPKVVMALAHASCAVVCDMGYTRVVRGWRAQLAVALQCPLLQVEANVVVPIRTASRVLEHAAAPLRPKIKHALSRFTQPVPCLVLDNDKSDAAVDTAMELLSKAGIARLNITSPFETLAILNVDRSVPYVPGLRGGPRAAMEKLQRFVKEHLSSYHRRRKDPAAQCQSQLSPYLHFGHISTLQVILWLRQHVPGAEAEAWIEELVVRRELARNMVYFNPDGYDNYDGAVPPWARQSLQAHTSDPRPRLFSFDELDRGLTNDPAWNAAQHEMVASGHMHNYMRMYWCKQLLTWTPSPREAFEIAVRLNDRWELDGRDENGYMGIAWCFGNHDREFPERPIFGSVRCMTRSGLKGKVDEARYIEVVRRKCARSVNGDNRYMTLLPNNGMRLMGLLHAGAVTAKTEVNAKQDACKISEGPDKPLLPQTLLVQPNLGPRKPAPSTTPNRQPDTGLLRYMKRRRMHDT
mmetsp:Transcript_46364/g.91950  ORF Transcript_46364/g.91950 Transcript_46364/m.91950 type:complete len:574 (+) Transcript_46364:53-1774(+)|eukprot:CAMPEP_0172807818 /NCGR_PEP_ID=MMETSP1075-20121228/7266_1 /TAXON_ID=2916 /ORGANISM="Ceratium fusus, Strain PA161109" /LENGTH=573 /DNA_ID=CAMNT_0013646859 /DNA_START=48 /DNA_END=1769 /DNA_ORIENTATION=+